MGIVREKKREIEREHTRKENMKQRERERKKREREKEREREREREKEGGKSLRRTETDRCRKCKMVERPTDDPIGKNQESATFQLADVGFIDWSTDDWSLMFE